MIRKANRKDLPDVYRLICILEEGKEPEFRAFQSIYEKMLSNEHYALLIASQDDHILGFLDLRFEEQLHHGGAVAEILELVVDPAIRSMGIGKTLLEATRQEARDHSCQLIECSSDAKRKRAHAFYERNGMICDHLKFAQKF